MNNNTSSTNPTQGTAWWMRSSLIIALGGLVYSGTVVLLVIALRDSSIQGRNGDNAVTILLLIPLGWVVGTLICAVKRLWGELIALPFSLLAGAALASWLAGGI